METHHFNELDRINKTSSLIWVYQSMEIELDEFKKKNPTSIRIGDVEAKINALRELYIWLRLRYHDFEVLQSQNMQSIRLNAILQNEVDTLKKENEKLTKILEL